MYRLFYIQSWGAWMKLIKGDALRTVEHCYCGGFSRSMVLRIFLSLSGRIKLNSEVLRITLKRQDPEDAWRGPHLVGSEAKPRLVDFIRLVIVGISDPRASSLWEWLGWLPLAIQKIAWSYGSECIWRCWQPPNPGSRIITTLCHPSKLT